MADKNKIIEEVVKYRNPYPDDLFLWDNPEPMGITRGKFNQFVHEVVENTIKDVIKIIQETEDE